jgi:hypothetical protein
MILTGTCGDLAVLNVVCESSELDWAIVGATAAAPATASPLLMNCRLDVFMIFFLVRSVWRPVCF